MSLDNDSKRMCVHYENPKDQELNPVIHQIIITEHQIQYHEQTSSGALFPIGQKPFNT